MLHIVGLMFMYTLRLVVKLVLSSSF